MVFLEYLRIAVFVWARAVCGTRICCSASARSSGAVQKIHMRKIEWLQGVARACNHDEFHDSGTFDEAPGTLQMPRGPR